jgi:hypothetical protein
MQKSLFIPKAESGSVVTPHRLQERQGPSASPMVLTVAALAQNITPWGVDVALRDKELRSFWFTEPWLASVVYSTAVRNASYEWQIVGADSEKPQPTKTIQAVTRLLSDSNKGGGWMQFITQLSQDMYTQDNGAWVEIVRAAKRPDAPVINLNQLDSARVRRTGDPKFPAIYTNKNGIETPMAYWRISSVEDLPTPIENGLGIQVCAVSRALLAAEIIESIEVYKKEKVGGTFQKAIDIVTGVTQTNINDALATHQEQILNQMIYRFSLPIILPGVDPTATLSHIHIDLASLPDNYDEETSMKWYIATLANCFGVDYQDIAPIFSGTLGTSSQSQVLHLKTQGKGPAYFLKSIERLVNTVIPNNVRFEFLEHDVQSEKDKAEAAFTRSKDRSMRLDAGELTPSAARELAVMVGDLPRWLKEEIEEEMKNMDVVERPTGPISDSPENVTTGIESQQRRTVRMLDELRMAISRDPSGFLEAWQREHGRI